MPPALVGRYLAPFIGQEGVTHLLALARAIRTDDIEDLDLSQVRAHSLIIRGEKDVWIEPTVAEKLSTELPGCRIVNFPGAARLVPEEAPEDLADLVASFVSPHVTRAADALEALAEPLVEHSSTDAGTTDGETA
jgi:pimeloyl-ACP methyl ester carboxylesterase